MSLCINPGCSNPKNPDSHLFCQACGSELLLLGRYRVTRLLSKKGGFGYTYEVIDNGIPKVLKVLINDQPHAVELFQQEAEVLNKLKHPGIPKGENYFNYFSRNNPTPLHCLVMEKIEGIDLEEYYKERDFQPINQDLALDWLSQLIIILHEVHRRNFFHRDIKPSNIILKPDGQLSLIDFGAVRQVTATIISGGQNTKISTLGYAPPEQERGYAVPQSDFYALGRTFVYLLTGKEPNDSAVYDYHHNELKWHQLVTHIDTRLVEFIDKLMADKVIERPPDTTILIKKLSRLKQDLLQPATSLSLPTVSQKQTITQKKSNPVIVSSPPSTLQYGGFKERFKAAIIDEIIVMSLAALLGGYFSFKGQEMGILAHWGIRWNGAIRELITWSAIASALGTTFIGFILTTLGIYIFLFNTDFLTDFLSLKLDDNTVETILIWARDHLLWLAPIILGGSIKWIYFVVLESVFKTTLGKYFLGLQVRDLNGNRLTLRKANKRYWGKLLSTLPLYFGFIVAGFTKRKRALHDLMAGSIVVKKNTY